MSSGISYDHVYDKDRNSVKYKYNDKGAMLWEWVKDLV